MAGLAELYHGYSYRIHGKQTIMIRLSAVRTHIEHSDKCNLHQTYQRRAAAPETAQLMMQLVIKGFPSSLHTFVFVWTPSPATAAQNNTSRALRIRLAFRLAARLQART